MPENSSSTKNIELGYKESLNLAKLHYENFPVISFFIPKSTRKHIAIVYWFARTSDDFADEGDLDSAIRIKKLNEFEESLTSAIEGKPDNYFIAALVNTINEKELTHRYFYNLLKAFKQDVVKKRYESFEELLEYCKHSANPVGRIILELFDIRNEEAKNYSDKICTALQLTNFYQDTLIDFNKGRIYYPADEMEKFGATEKLFELKENNHNLQQLVKYNVDRARSLFDEGALLLNYLNGRQKYEIGWTIKSGVTILDKIQKNDFDVLNFRPVLGKTDYTLLFLRTLFK
jgi:phytoene synthase